MDSSEERSITHIRFNRRQRLATDVPFAAVRPFRQLGLPTGGVAPLAARVGIALPFRQVILNLVGNAIKFTARGEVMVEVAMAPRPDAADDTAQLLFTVRDTGIGIAREKQAAIFRAFEQEDSSTTRRYGGTGLGLTISAQLAALMGGGIAVDSEPGRGSTFTFAARFARSSRPAPDTRSVSPERLEDLRVLVVDDNESNRRILAEWLTSWRMRPLAVDDVASALDTLARAEQSGAPYSLVLLDSRMPDGDGITLAAEIRERFGASKRLVLLSSEDSPTLVARSREAGIQAYLLKPVQQSELLDTIWAVMNTPDTMPNAALGMNGGGTLAVAATAAGLRILVAEDNELNVTLLRELLSQRGHRAHIVGDGRGALALATDGTFDVLLLDLHMPEMDGFEVVRAIRERERATGRHLPIVALTARSASRDRARCLAAGMDDFLSKPVQADALWAAVDRMTAAISSAKAPATRLLDPRAILRACHLRQALRGVSTELARSHDALPIGAQRPRPSGPARGRAHAPRDAGRLLDHRRRCRVDARGFGRAGGARELYGPRRAARGHVRRAHGGHARAHDRRAQLLASTSHAT